jgi:hypothetical protein
MKRVDIFVVGGAKCGTTWLHHMLCQRMDVAMPAQKETNFFAHLGQDVKFAGPHDDENTNKHTVRDIGTYHALFNGNDKLWLEICPSYLYVEGAAENIYRYNPAAKIMIILRNPVDRAWSNYQHLVRDGAEDRTFEQALELENERSQAGWVWFWDLYRQGLYSRQVSNYLSRFPRSAVYVARFEDIHRDPAGFMRKVEAFMELSPYQYPGVVEKNESGIPAKGFGWLHRFLFMPGSVNQLLRKGLPLETRKRLAARFKRVVMRKGYIQEQTRKELMNKYRRDIRALEHMIDMDLSEWVKE